jgi:hypothetical protein
MAVYTKVFADAQNESLVIQRVDENNTPVVDYPDIVISLIDFVALVGAASDNDAKFREFAVCDLGTGALKKVALMASDFYT